MAATVSAWAKPGAWALDAEENESELLKQSKEDAVGSGKGGDTADFPSLSAAAAVTKSKKKKPQKLSLQEFATFGAEKPAASSQPKGLTPDELMMLPTGPRQRTAEELDRNKLGGGFRSYGGGLRDEQPRRQGSFNRDANREIAPSRADEIDNWAAAKKSPGFDRRDRGDRGGFFSDQSRADEVDNWASNKSFVPSEPRRYDRRGSFGSDSNSSGGGADSNNWIKRKEEERRTGGAFDSLRQRRGGFDGADSETWGKKPEEAAGAGGRPRLNLQPRTVPVSNTSAPASGAASPVKAKGSNPFGEARPREEVLKEKGQDWKEIDEKLESNKLKEVVSAGHSDGAPKRGFWSGNGRDEMRQEAKAVGAWRRPPSRGSRPQSAAGSESAGPENGHTEQAK
ncbi:eukaryotic translation initiation factor 4B3 [Andrographis paniculata]|uniref:eukaryotic translation initiation factor 4B3 n=1 Tax=Andrographis paniculata TaxID=175694 RepID=UPI0021E9A8A2|nr:eukaryotic translation initiation factor 4B3 [Andrographis paniculata]